MEGTDLDATQRMVSATCFRVLSLHRETQNEVDVLKPILEECEVLRLSCALGALTNVNIKDFQHDFLEAHEFDDDFAQFLRSDVFGANGKGGGPVVRVQGLFGKQAQVKTHLQTIGAWDQAMEATLQRHHMGLYAVVMPSDFAPDNVKMVVVFSWLMEEFLHMDSLRGTPTYLMRLLTCLTPHVTCCLSEEDKKLMEDIAGSEDTGQGSYGKWQSYSVGLQVAQQQDAKDDVKSSLVTTLPFPPMPVKTKKVGIVKGSFPALTALSEAPSSSSVTHLTKKFRDVPQMCDWLVRESKRFDLRAANTAPSWPQVVKESLLFRFGAYPSEKLDDIDDRLKQRAVLFEEQCRHDLQKTFDERRDVLRRAGDEVFRVESLLSDDENRTETAINVIRNMVQDIRSTVGTIWWTPDRDAVRVMNFPLRFPKFLKHLFALHRDGDEDAIRELLAKGDQVNVKDLLSTSNTSFLGRALRWFVPTSDISDTQLSEAFRQRMQEPCSIYKAMWWSEITQAMDAHFAHVTNTDMNASVERKKRMLELEGDEQKGQVIAEAFMNLLESWECTHQRGLTLKVFSIACRSQVICSYHEESLVPGSDQMQIWSIKDKSPGLVGPPALDLLGVARLADGEQITGVFTIQARSVLVVSSIAGRTRVKKIEFSSAVSTGLPLVTMIRELPRSAVLCDYYPKERFLIVADVAGLVGIYRLSENFKSLEVVRSVNASLKTSLEMPLASLLLNDGTLYMTDSSGAIQSLNTRNQQTSRKISLQRSGPGSTRLFRVQDGEVVGYLAANEDSEHAPIGFIAADNMRPLPQTSRPRLSTSVTIDSPCEAVGDHLFVADTTTKELHVVKLEATLQSDSFRLQRVGGTDPSNASLLEKHWLWVFYHLYEKFPVRGKLFEESAKEETLNLSLVCDASCEEGDSSTVDQGCKTLLRMVMRKLRRTNKDMFGLKLGEYAQHVFCGANAVDILPDYCKTAPVAVAALVRELVTFVPVQICRAEYNTLMLMSDGKVRPQEHLEGAVNSADIARTLRFGLLSPLLTSWRGQCIVVTSMGKQSTGKSYYLNHLTGSSFAIAGARCTDGAWMSVRVLPSNVLLVVIDFEGLGSFERTEQEDVFLSVLNASVSMLTIFRTEMRFDREVDELFSKFQKGSQLLKKDPQLFRGTLYMAVKDVNPNDQRGVVDEFMTKVQRLVDANKSQNFLSDMYANQLEINCSPPLGTVSYYESLSDTQMYMERRLLRDSKAGFASGKAFLDCIRLMLAKISILDWTSLDESAIKFKIAEVTQKLPGVLRFGCVVESGASTSAVAGEELLHAFTNATIAVSVEELCAANASMAIKWRALDAWLQLDQIEDHRIDFGECVLSLPTEVDKMQAASSTIQSLFVTYRARVQDSAGDAGVGLLKQSMQVEFDAFLSFIVRRRCARAQKWCRSVFNDVLPEGWQAVEQQAFEPTKTLLVRCHSTCARCQLGCMKVSAHSSNGDSNHDCGTNHACAGVCEYCRDLFSAEEGEAPSCSKPAGHKGKCECADGDHTCRERCVLHRANNCGQFCAKKAGHDDSHEHRCSVGMHKCGDPCAAQGCTRVCVQDIEVEHTIHKCEADHCIAKCLMTGCTRTCSSKDHFHGMAVARAAFAAENPSIVDKSGDTFDIESDAPVVHMCEEPHACPEMCEHDGICHIDVFLKQSAKTFAGARESFQYTYQEMNGSRKKCAHVLAPGQTTHSVKHSCCSSSGADAVTQGDEEEKHEHEDEGSDRVRHYCNVRCPSCSYYCQKQFGHSGVHKTTHGNMRNTMFLSDEREIDLIDRKYVAGESGMAEMCNLYCSKMGRGHVHYLECEGSNAASCVYKGDSEDMRRHCTRALEPAPDKEQDELLHERFWDTLGWEDPCTSAQEREQFAKCAYKCDAPDHEGEEESYCILPAWHLPVSGPADGSSGDEGCSFVGGHQFECSHKAAGNKMHHVFVLDASGSMHGDPWAKLLSAFNEYVHSRISNGSTDDLVSVITFDSTATIVWEAEPITAMPQAPIPFTGKNTSFSAGLRAANEVLSRVELEQYKPVVVFFSDGQPYPGFEGKELASHIQATYAKYDLAAFAVGFGDVNLSVLKDVAQQLGGEYRHALSGDELKTTFHTISASLGTRVGLALTKPQHDKECAICLAELSTGSTTVLAPCQHQLHQRCYRLLLDSPAPDGTRRCPTCRQAITTV